MPYIRICFSGLWEISGRALRGLGDAVGPPGIETPNVDDRRMQHLFGSPEARVWFPCLLGVIAQ